MSKRRSWEAENEGKAADLMVRHLGGTWVPRDPGGGPKSLHDFDLVTEQGTRIAVEVTRLTDPARAAANAAIEDGDWKIAGLRSDWVVDIRGTPRVKRLKAALPAPMGVVDRSPLDRYIFEKPEVAGEPLTEEVSDALRLLRGLGVRLLYRLGEPAQGPGELMISEATVVGSTGTVLLVTAAQSLAVLPDNLRKLSTATGYDEAHLFVWIEASRHAEVAAMSSPWLPDTAPRLPEPVQAVWLVTAFEESVVWLFDRTTGWADLGRFAVEPNDQGQD